MEQLQRFLPTGMPLPYRTLERHDAAVVHHHCTLICHLPGGMKIIPAPLSPVEKEAITQSPTHSRLKTQDSSPVVTPVFTRENREEPCVTKAAAIAMAMAARETKKYLSGVFIPLPVPNWFVRCRCLLIPLTPFLLRCRYSCFVLRKTFNHHHGLQHRSFAAAPTIQDRFFFSMCTSSHPSRVSLKGHT